MGLECGMDLLIPLYVAAGMAVVKMVEYFIARVKAADEERKKKEAEKERAKRPRAEGAPCPMTQEERLPKLDALFTMLAEKDPITSLPRWYTPPDWKERMDDIETAITVVHSAVESICTKHESCNASQAKALEALRKENERLSTRLDALQEIRIAEAKEAGDRLLDFATKIEKGVNGRRTSSRRAPVVEPEPEYDTGTGDGTIDDEDTEEGE